MGAPQAKLPAAGAELVTVSIGAQQFAIEIVAVREIRGWTSSTPLPHAPSHFLGMINLRGSILPVIDLGARLGLGVTRADSSSVVVVVQIGERQVGLLVDAVCDIHAVTEGLLQRPPDVGAGASHDFVNGVMTTEQGIVSLLRLDNIIPAEADEAAA